MSCLIWSLHEVQFVYLHSVISEEALGEFLLLFDNLSFFVNFGIDFTEFFEFEFLLSSRNKEVLFSHCVRRRSEGLGVPPRHLCANLGCLRICNNVGYVVEQLRKQCTGTAISLLDCTVCNKNTMYQ